MKRLLILLLFSCHLVTHAQMNINSELKSLNNYANFINESIHGMLIAHRLLENYNQEINKYVDLDGYQINNFSNKDLPANIFEDSDQWFYEVSPYLLFQKALKESVNLPPEEASFLNSKLNMLKDDIDGINRIRFTIPDYINSHQLENQEELQGVYDLLEEAVRLFDHFFEVQKETEVALIANARRFSVPDQEIMDVVQAMDMVWFSSKNILRSVREKKDENLKGQSEKLMLGISEMAAIELSQHPYTSLNGAVSQRAWKISLDKTKMIVDKAKKMIETADVPVEYKLYGKFYYYHNAVLTTQMNRYGFGFVHEMNKIIDEVSIPILYRIEEPHFYRVIYPKKLVQDETIASSDDNIVQLPQKLKNREIISSTRTIQIDTSVLEITLYDHKIQDGDIVSINYNGDWILENYSLEAERKIIKLKINENGKNYLLLHAENEGKRPPNTMALSYYYRGKKEIITLSSNLSESEMIEILYDPK